MHKPKAIPGLRLFYGWESSYNGNGVMEEGSIGVMEYWNNAELRRWVLGFPILRYSNTPVLPCLREATGVTVRMGSFRGSI